MSLCAACRAVQRPMVREALLASLQLLDSLRIARCMLSYLALHHDEVEPLLDLFAALGVRCCIGLLYTALVCLLAPCLLPLCA
jgi:hypothetical protein